jgi:protein-S-isoprenylcysteine O-methyltransferase Ste14
MKPFMIRCGDFFFKFRNYLFPAVFAAVWIVSRPAFFMDDPRLDRAVVAFGALLAGAGQAFRLAVIGYAYIKRGGKDGKVYADHLVVRGFYSHTRNPMYVGNLAIVWGLCIMYGSAFSCFFAIPFFTFAYLCITATEENYLRTKFGGEYAAYERRVNRFIPNFAGIGESLKDYRYDWKRAIRKDYGNVFQALTGMLLVAGWKSYHLGGSEALMPVSVVAAIGVGFYIAARYLKKTGRLASPNG